MSASIYDDKTIEPTDKMLVYDLKTSKAYLDSISDFIEKEYGNYKPEWKFYNKKSGWILKMISKKRNLLFIVPLYDYFKVAFTFGDKATDLIFKSKLPESIKKKTADAKKYVEGRTIQLEVKNEKELQNIIELIKIKMT